ncbi:pyridoxamine 5'-phosphate oxidase family protein [Corynebacterium sputi]|uniref:pyridoxamine 5'-phosphate oxidase family protein n=1 Tax=Corynebacterium sputi TaxID=489915 RepID=UPI0004797E6E|nr:pyridoxamine 5'-phosphate oxidase family protein [Corynebacterium sputi]
MSQSHNPVKILSNDECFELLDTQSFGRVVVRRKDDMDLFPLNYVAHEGKVYFRTAEGTKLFSLALNADVLFEADHVDQEAQTAWSVIIKGTARALSSTKEIEAADDLPLRPWLPTLKYNYVEITPKEVSGRAFELGSEPDRY